MFCGVELFSEERDELRTGVMTNLYKRLRIKILCMFQSGRIGSKTAARRVASASRNQSWQRAQIFLQGRVTQRGIIAP